MFSKYYIYMYIIIIIMSKMNSKITISIIIIRNLYKISFSVTYNQYNHLQISEAIIYI